MAAFLESAAWYRKRGIPWRRGYLLYGPPGTGKTSFIKAAASHLRLNVCRLTLSDENVNDQLLANLLANPPEPSLVIFEDIDAAFVQREATDRRASCAAAHREPPPSDPQPAVWPSCRCSFAFLGARAGT